MDANLDPNLGRWGRLYAVLDQKLHADTRAILIVGGYLLFYAYIVLFTGR